MEITFKLVRSFKLGFAILSPKLNGFCVEFYVGCFHVAVWYRKKWEIRFENYWESS